MASPNLDSSLNDVVIEYLKKVKCEKPSKMFESKCASENTCLKPLSEFIKFLKQKETMKESVEDDLGFEINFGAFQPTTKVSLFILSSKFQIYLKLPFKEERKTLNNRTNQVSKKESGKRMNDVPNEFIKKIKNLGMKVEDAHVLFQTKIDWTAVYSENKIYCIEPACDFFTMIDNEELTNHMINVHKYGDYPCKYDHCDYVATSKVKNVSVLIMLIEIFRKI